MSRIVMHDTTLASVAIPAGAQVTYEYLPSVTLGGLKRLHLDVVMEPVST